MAGTSETGPDKTTPEGRGSRDLDVATVRSFVAMVIWMVARLFAVVLVVGALCVVLELNQDNAIVDAITDAAGGLDFGVFKMFEGDNADRNEALVNWGIAAAIWLGIGKALERLIRP